MLPLRLAPALEQKRAKAISSPTGSPSSSSSPASAAAAAQEAEAAAPRSATAVLAAPPSSLSPIPGAVEIPGGGPSSLLEPPPLQQKEREKKRPKTFLPRERQLERSRDDTDTDTETDGDGDGGDALRGEGANPSSSSASSLAERRQRSGLAPGAIDPSNPLGRRARELRGRRAYLKNFWYAVALSEEVAEGGEGRRPLGVTALGRRLALFRDAGDGGRVRAVSDVCPHRGAPLHRGWVSDEIEVGAGDAGAGAGGGRRRSCVVCPYHGWAFDGEGVLRDVPAAEHADEWPRRQLVESYPIVEKGGFVWLFYGEGKVFYVFFSSTR